MKIRTGNFLFRILSVMAISGAIWFLPSPAKANLQGGERIQVSGTVTDTKGSPLVGVSVVIMDPVTGTTTDLEGNYTLNNVLSDGTITFSYVGMQSREIAVGGRGRIDVVLVDEALDVEGIVVTAYATQKKINVTGAISTVAGKDLVSTPVSNIANALIGTTPGVSGLQTSGEPGRNAANIRIRGIATYGGSDPLVVIDGIEQPAEDPFTQFNAIDPNEILSLSILKDASSTAVFGIRGANGVIIVTTKRGSEGRPVVNFSASYGVTKATNMQKSVSSHDWAYMRNEAVRHEMDSYASASSYGSYIYSQVDLWKFRNNRDFTPQEVAAMTNLTDAQKQSLMNSPALYYGSTDTYREIFGSYGPQAQVNASISGGTERVKYYTSLGYFKQEGITKDYKYYNTRTGSEYTRYNFRSNFDIDIRKNLRLSINLAGQFGTAVGPGNTDDPYDLDARYQQIMQWIYETNPFMNQGIMDGHLISWLAGAPGSAQNPLELKTGYATGRQNAIYNIIDSGTSEIYNSMLDNTIKLEHELDYLVKGLKIHGTVNFQDNYNRVVARNPSVPGYTVQRSLEDPNVLEYFDGTLWNDGLSTRGSHNWNKFYLDAGINWAGSFGDHNVSGLALWKASRYFIPWDPNGYYTPSGLYGVLGRVTYDYDSRYLVEFNAGYNGTEQFAKGRRFGFFPAYSAGWVMSREDFFPENRWVNFAKIRGSYGKVGNDQLYSSSGTRRYLYLPSTYNYSDGYWFGNTGNTPGNYYTGIGESVLGYYGVMWEKANKTDIGLELRMIDNRMGFTFDWFRETRNNILTIPSNQSVVDGVNPENRAPANVGKTRNKGYEIVLNWSDRAGEFGYTVEAHVSYARNKVLYKAEASNPYYWMNETGYSIGQPRGYKSDGLYNTVEELANRPYVQATSNQATLGDIRYVDLNGDGVIDNQDIAPIGYPNFPEYHFGLKLGFNYKGFELNALFNGTANGSFYIDPQIAIPFFKKGGNAWQWQFDGRWTEEKAASGAKITFPRATFDATGNHNNYLTSDYWMYSNNFIKLKNLELAYSFSADSRWMKASRISGLRIYLNGNNLLTIKNPMRKLGIDPETTDGNFYIYPLTRVFNIGVNIQF